ncbi:unnamed protein product [Parajaminaea phylloscopi]
MSSTLPPPPRDDILAPSPSTDSEEFPLRLLSDNPEPSLAADGSITFHRSLEPSQAVLTQSRSTLDLTLPRDRKTALHEHDARRRKWWSFDRLRNGNSDSDHGRRPRLRAHSLITLSKSPLALQKIAPSQSTTGVDILERQTSDSPHLKDSSDGISSTEAAREAAMLSVRGSVVLPLASEVGEIRAGGHKIARRVSFSPSTDERDDVVEAPAVDTTSKSHRRSGSKPSFELRPRRSSLQWARRHIEEHRPRHRRSHSELTVGRDGIHVTLPGSSPQTHGHSRTRSADSSPAKVKVSKQTALAQRHAKALEQLINASQSGSAVVVGKRVASRKQILQLKKALLDAKLANGIIGELRMMNISDDQLQAMANEYPEGSTPSSQGDPTQESRAREALRAVAEQAQSTGVSNDVEAHPSKSGLVHRAKRHLRNRLSSAAVSRQAKSVPAQKMNTSVSDTRSRPIRAVCLDCSESEADQRHFSSTQSTQSNSDLTTTASAGSAQHATDTAVGNSGAGGGGGGGGLLAYLTGLGEQQPSNLKASTATAAPTPLAVLGINPSLSGVNVLNLIASPMGTAATSALDASGAVVALGNVTGAAIKASGANDGVYPPTDRMALFVHWWGYEVTLPEASMSYLSTAHSVSGAFLNFLSTMVVTGGVPELLPFVRYVSMAVDVEFKAIQNADRGQGVVLAATWVMPLALVPRPWDYAAAPPSTGTPGSNPQATSAQGMATKKVAAVKAQSLTASAVPAAPASMTPTSGPEDAASPSPSPSARVRPNDAAIQAAKTEGFVGDLPPPSSMTPSPGNSRAGTPRASMALERLEEIPEGGESLRIK